MGTNEQLNSQFDELFQQTADNELNLILHNDEENTFDHVIESLVEVCKHDSNQAEQCAFITHYKGKCDVKKGGFETLSYMKSRLQSKGLTVTID